MKWEATTDGETIEITDENNRIVADYVAEDIAPIIEAAPNMLKVLEDFLEARKLVGDPFTDAIAKAMKKTDEIVKGIRKSTNSGV